MVRRVPAGVIGAITPWNSPSVLGMRVVAPALALGNAVVLKPDPQTPVCGGAMFEAVFREAGLPEGLLHVVLGGAEVGEAIVTDPNVNRSCRSPARPPPAGGSARWPGGLLKKVSARARRQQRLRRPRRRRPRRAAAAGAFASFQFQGQVCFAAGRHIVHRSVADDYVDALTEKAKRLRTGDPYREDVDLGPIVNEKQVEPGSTTSSAARSRAARGVRGRHARGPVLPADRAHRRHTDQPAWTDEIFGPVAPVVAFDTDEEAIALANESEYGLVGAVYSRSISRGLALAQRIRSGMVHVNDGRSTTRRRSRSAGWALSGNGSRYGGEANLDSSPSGSG